MQAPKHSTITKLPTADSRYSEAPKEQFLQDLQGIYPN